MNRLLCIALVCLLQVSLAFASTFNLSVEVAPSGAASLNTSGGTYEEGSSIYLRTYANTGFVFKGWYEGETLLSSSMSFSYTMPSKDVLVQARYEYDPAVPDNPSMPDTTTYYSLTATVSPIGAGSLNTYSGKYAVGASVYMRTNGNTGYQFVGWQNNVGETVSTSSSFNYTMPRSDANLTALYIYDPSVPANPDSMATRYTVTIACKPVGGGTFNTTSATAEEGGNVHLYAYTNTGYRFLRWENEVGETVSTAQNFYYIMPHGNSKLYGIFEYDPAVPGNPNKNYWNKELGEVIVDDFSPGSLGGAVSAAISGSNRSDVAMITVAGRMNDNDFGIANDYTNCTLLDLSRVTGVTAVPSYAFDYTNLESVYLPVTIEKIGYRAFYECKQLSSLIVYAMTPPVLENQVFTNVPEGLIVYVPASSINQYQDAEGWKNFTILPIQEDIRSISISLPEGANAADYAQMWLELTNTKSGQRMHFVMTDRQTYTFANIIRNTSWNVTLRNERGDIFGQIDNVEVKDEDVSVTFSSLSKPQSVVLSVLTPDGQDVTDQTQVTWTDAQGNYVAQGVSLTGLPTGYQATYRIVLSQELAMAYNTPRSVDYVLTDGDNRITCQLNAIPQVKISGKVKDASTGLPLSGAFISASQTFDGKYSKTLNAKTDGNGVFTFDIANVPTSVAFAASDYVSQTVNCDSLLTGVGEVTLPDVSLKTIMGATITLGFTYTSCEGEMQNWYSDYQNVSYELFNITKNKTVSQYNVQYPQIVLLEEVADGDVLRLTATSRTNSFMPVTATATIAEQKAEATFAVVELGKIQSSFTSTGNAAVVGSLYDVAGKLMKTYNYSEASLTINDLADGQYTLVSMGNSRLFNTIYDLSQLPQTGLVEGTDYVQNSVEVKSGQVSTISISEVPMLDESKLYYTGDNTSFTVNKPSIVVGNYLTLTGHIDFKPAYATNVNNVQMIVDLPESCEFVENSVMVGNSTSSYTINGNQVTIPMTRYTDRVRFCIIPILGGEYAPSAFAQFDLDGETVTQPIGSAIYTAKDLSITVPSTVAKTSIIITGTAIGKSDIEIFDGEVMIGQTSSLANGTWTTTCELSEPYNMSRHLIYAEVTTKHGLTLKTENKNCLYNKNAIRVEKVTMINTAHPSSSLNTCEYVTTFDFQNPSNNSATYWYWPNYPDFTFLIDFTNNDTILVKDVSLHVKTDANDWVSLPANYDHQKRLWVSMGTFASGNTPKNVAVAYNAVIESYADREEMDRILSEYDDSRNSVIHLLDTLNALHKEMIADSIAAIDRNQQIEQLISDINTVLSQETYDSETFRSKSAQLLTLLEYPCTADMLLSDEVVDSDEELDSLYDSLVRQLADYPEYEDSIDIRAYLAEMGQLFFEDAAELEILLNAQFNDTVIVENNGISQEVFPVRYSSIDKNSFHPDSVTLVKMDTGLPNIIVFQDTYTLVLDQERERAWCLRKRSPYHQRLKTATRNSETEATNDSKLEDLLKEVLMELSNFSSTYRSASNEFSQSLKNITDEAANYQRIIDREILLRDRVGQRIYDNARKLDNFSNNAIQRNRFIQKHLTDLTDQVAHHEKVAADYSARLSALNPLKYKIGMYGLKGAFIAAFLKSIYNIGSETVKLDGQLSEAIGALVALSRLANSLEDCPGDQINAYALAEDIRMTRTGYYLRFLRDGSFSLASILWNVYALRSGSSPWKKQLVKDLGKASVQPALESIFSYNSSNSMDQALADFWKEHDDYVRLKSKLKCLPKTDEARTVEHSNNADASVVMDPSGYVYEGVASNRVEGVAATAYYKEMVEDMYGDLHENIVKWDAEEYAQENPLFTDEYGMYAWDVPNGLWQVKFEKEGYETTYSEWLPVPPPQLDVNIAMKQNRQPEVKAARAYEDAVEVEFDKYMMPELLTAENIMVMQNGTAVKGTVELLNEEVSYEGDTVTFASKVRFNATEPFDATEITLIVNNRVKSYAGIRMQDNYQQTFSIEQEIKRIVCDSLLEVGYGKTGTMAVSVLPASASKGKTLTVKTSSPMILGVVTKQVTIGNDGKAEITVSGELPGTAALTFKVEGTDKEGLTIVSVEANKTVVMPKASIASGTVVEKGTAITFTCETEGATIYYTLDGSCPCDNTDARKVYDGTPIIINETVTIKAMAMAPGMYESDVAEFTYIVDGTGIDDISVNEQIHIYPLPVHDMLNISAGGKMIKNVTVSSMNGVVVTSVEKPATIVKLYVGTIPIGIYIVNIHTEDSMYSRKILKVE